MHKLIALYSQPDDTASFDAHYAQVHRPLVERIPGLARIVVNRGVDAPWGAAPPYYQIVEMHFPDEPTFKAAMASPENAAAGKDLRKFAANIVTLMVAHEI
ncbi:MAG: EthD family reductase [Steroidobacter sp.]